MKELLQHLPDIIKLIGPAFFVILVLALSIIWLVGKEKKTNRQTVEKMIPIVKQWVYTLLGYIFLVAILNFIKGIL